MAGTRRSEVGNGSMREAAGQHTLVKKPAPVRRGRARGSVMWSEFVGAAVELGALGPGVAIHIVHGMCDGSVDEILALRGRCQVVGRTQCGIGDVAGTRGW